MSTSIPKKISRSLSRSSKDSKSVNTTSNQNLTMQTAKITALILICYNLLIIGYIITLEGTQCDCIRDWRHDFIKYYSIFMICYSLIISLLSNVHNKVFEMILHITLYIAALVNVWCLYTYIGDLDKTYCTCAVEKQKKMHYFLYNWRYILVGIAILSIFSIIFHKLSNK